MPAAHPVFGLDQAWPCPLNIVKRRQQAAAEADEESDFSACRRMPSDSSHNGDQTLTIVKRRRGVEIQAAPLANLSTYPGHAVSNKSDQELTTSTSIVRPALSSIPN